MAMRSLAFSIFILIMCLTFTLVNALSNDLNTARGDSEGQLNTAEPLYSLTDIGWSKNASTLKAFGLDSMVNTQEVDGGSFGKVTTSSIVYTTLFYSSTGFDTFMRQLLGISSPEWEGTTIVLLIELAMVLVMLNHGFVLLQLLMNVFGVL